jgi:membrane protease YdiL (CAAX protease family)
MSADPGEQSDKLRRGPGDASEQETIRGMSGFGAIWWAATITFLYLSLWVVFSRLQLFGTVLTAAVLIQSISYGAGLFLLLRVYSPESEIRSILALRAPRLFPLLAAPALGFALSVACNYLHGLVLDRFPQADEGLLVKDWGAAQVKGRIAIIIAVAVIGPFVEETIFRGALFTYVRKYARTASPFSLAAIFNKAIDPRESERAATEVQPRPHESWETIIATSLGFILVHLDPRSFPPLVVAALALGWLRARTDSLWPGVLCHMSFNAMPFILDSLFGAELETIPPSWAAFAALAAAGILGLLVATSRSRTLEVNQ